MIIKKDFTILSLLVIVSIVASILGGMFWRSEEVHRLRGVIDLKNNTLLQTETYLNQFDFNEIARNNWRQLGYNIYAKNDTVKFKQ